MKHILIGAAFVLAASTAFAGKPATQATKEAQAQVLTSLPFDNTEDFKLAKRGLIARPDPLIIKNDNENGRSSGGSTPSTAATGQVSKSTSTST